MKNLSIYTIGHSTRPLDEFISLLHVHDITLLADVRTIPRSRHNPQFNIESLSQDLPKQGIVYIHFKGLGGLRHAKKDSVNTGWKNAAFRGYADYMQTEEFEKNLDDLIAQAKKQTTAIMCAEAVPWRCHRSLIADALLVRKIKVIHIMSKTTTKEHALTAWAEVEGRKIIYPALEPDTAD
ncbi:MAG: DUF488 domain-containing protein [Nitrospirota bacterium]